MKIIVLNGGTSTGKTTTMGVVFVALHMNGGKVNNFTALKTPSGMDFDADFDYPHEGKPLKVAIYSKGDSLTDCNNAISKYSSTMDILIIAYSKQTPLTIPAGDILVPVQKTFVSSKTSEVQANANDGYQIISLI